MVFLMMENSVSFAKECLKDSNLLPRFFIYGDGIPHVLLTLYVKSYCKLQKNVIYYASAKIDDYRWTCKLVVANGTLFAFVSANVNLNKTVGVICKVRGDHLENHNTTLYEGLMISEFCQKALIDPKNGYLHGDSLVIEFRYKIELSENFRCSVQSITDSAEYCEAFKDLYLPSHDLNIKVGDLIFPCHKEVLSSHSKRFADFFQTNQPSTNTKVACIAIDEDPSLFQKVLICIYGGNLDCPDEKCMIEVYRIANVLQIDLLKTKCMDYIVANLSPSN